MARGVFAVVVVAAVLACVAAEVTVLTDSNFDEFIDGSQPALVEFYAPWCGHCKALAPEYEKVGAVYKRSDGVLVAKIDADAHKEKAGKFGIRGFPTLKWFPKGSASDPEDYVGGRQADDMINYINTKTGLSRKLKSAPSFVQALTDASFDAVVMNPESDVLVEFYAPWCGHCKQLAPIYEDLGKAYAAEENVVIAKVDADKHRDLAQKFGVSGFPTIKFFGRGDDKEAEDYQMGRDIDSFVTFLNGKAGTFRTSKGGLNNKAGRVEALDTLAARFMQDQSQAIIDEAAATATDAPSHRHYVKAMKKIVDRGTEYVAKEITRLTGMVESDSVNPNKKTLFQTRINVLRAFEAAATDDAEL